MEERVKSWQQYYGEKTEDDRRTHGGQCQVAAGACFGHLSWGICTRLAPPALPVWDDTNSLSAWLAHCLSISSLVGLQG